MLQNRISAEFIRATVFLYLFSISTHQNVKGDFPGGPVVKNAGCTGWIPGQGAKTPCALGPKNPNIKQKQYCNKYKKDFKKFCVCVLSCVWLSATLWTVSIQYMDTRCSIHGISQARTLEWVAMSFSRGSSPARDWTCVFCIGGQILYHSAPPGKPHQNKIFKKKCRRIRILPLSLQPLQLASLARPSARPVPVTPCVSLPGLHSRLGVGRVVKQQNVVFPPVLEVRCPRSSLQQVWFLLRLASLTCTWPRSPCVSR